MNNEKLDAIFDESIKSIPEWANWESHTFQNQLTDEGEYVKSEDLLTAFEKLKEKLNDEIERLSAINAELSEALQEAIILVDDPDSRFDSFTSQPWKSAIANAQQQGGGG
jgi:hypothetical protein